MPIPKPSYNVIMAVHNRVFIIPDNPTEITDGGIHLPDKAQDKPVRGRVYSVGPGRILDSGQRAKMSVDVGDKVIYNQYACQTLEHAGEEYIVIEDNQILAVITCCSLNPLTEASEGYV